MVERGKRVAQRRAGNLHQTRKRMTQLEDEKNCRCCRESTDEQCCDDQRIRPHEKPKADKNNCKPEYQYRQKGHWNSTVRLRKENTCLRQVDPNLNCSGVQFALAVVLGCQLQKLVKEQIRLRARFDGASLAVPEFCSRQIRQPVSSGRPAAKGGVVALVAQTAPTGCRAE